MSDLTRISITGGPTTVNFYPASGAAYVLTDASGLDSADQAVYVGLERQKDQRVPENREVTLKVRLNPTAPNNARTAREALYRLMGRDCVMRVYYNPNVPAGGTLYGSIKRIEASIFSPRTEVLIVFACDSPFISLGEWVFTPTTKPSFSTSIQHGQTFSGFIYTIALTATLSSIRLTKNDGNEMWIPDPNGLLSSGRQITFDTRPGYRRVYSTNVSNGNVVDLTYLLHNTSSWLTVSPAPSTFTLTLNTTAFNHITSGLKVYPEDWGI